MITDESIRACIDNKTKPVGALGELETLAFQICRLQHTTSPRVVKPHIIVFAADHGVSSKGVSAYPKDVTAQMMMNFVNGGAAINVLAEENNIDLVLVDAGVDYDFEGALPIAHLKVANGTQCLTQAPEMSSNQLQTCFQYAQTVVDTVESRGCNCIGFGEMGIGNTSSAALIMHYLTGIDLAECVGPGTGLNQAQLAHKLAVLNQAKAYHGSLPTTDAILTHVGGFEIAMMVAAMHRAAEANMVILVDGFIATAAAACAIADSPSIKSSMIFCHTSAETGQAHLLAHLNVTPILSLGMRLGEGSACALAMPIIRSAVAMMSMASFDSANVSKDV